MRQSSYEVVISVNGTETPLTGSLRVDIKLEGYKTSVQLEVWKGVSYDVILGRDFLKQNVDNIRYTDNTL